MPEDTPLLLGTLDLLILKAKYYKLTAAGKRQLEWEAKSWGRVVDVMRTALESS
jgi:hypothetical protein